LGIPILPSPVTLNFRIFRAVRPGPLNSSVIYSWINPFTAKNPSLFPFDGSLSNAMAYPVPGCEL
jgi:hypothetical protein